MSRTIKKPKTGGKAVSRHCKSHGSCNYCRDNRLIHTLKELDRTNSILNEQETLPPMSADS